MKAAEGEVKGVPERHPKVWGYEDWIENNDRYCGKLLFIEAGKKCSWHYHTLKEETFYVEQGCVIVRYGEDDDIEQSSTVILKAGDSFHVSQRLRHQIEALYATRLFEFSTTHYEDDSYRIIPSAV